ncbi:GyrI-like domain-containing protein [Leptospira stimsonii]|uniref:AraC family transcriptional regulator n=1 Tax=Leptospira stimsonii TaxID=2202203 RepID=A0ABY2NCR1_9LEPT|nr:GyrI-like domain-containing protein [Leptospira stimsonii]TGK20407.1 AraC family transcriptional regulator [Leptospira stimsonii]TGM21518.1 AraC family transcriptional regulator [Leptospira stimsonii]
MQFRIETLAEKKLIGMRVHLSLSENKTQELWKNFMVRKSEIRNRIGAEFYSMQIYEDSYFKNFDPAKRFEKWASVEVSDFDSVPVEMETTILPEGLYAVFFYKGSSKDGPKVFQYIFGTWFPDSDFVLDQRPHFELLGEKYRNDDPNSEEEIWIPIRQKK